MAMTLRLSDEDDKLLQELAEATGVSKHEAVVRSIREAASTRRHEEGMREASAKARARWADVLDRLGR